VFWLKLLIIGFDALDYEAYRKIKPEGFKVYPLLSPDPFTPIAWTSIYTGSSKERHGVKDLDWGPWLSHGGLPKGNEYFWHVLNKRGFKVELMNLPCTYPPTPVDRYMVSGFPLTGQFFSEAKSFTYPPDIEERLPKGYIEAMDMIHWQEVYHHLAWKDWLLQMSVEELLSRIHENCSLLIDTFIDLHSSETDLGFIQFSFLDRTGHIRHGYPESLSLVNPLIEKLKHALEPENILIVSDHGEALHPQGHKKIGVFAVKGNLTPAPSVDKVAASILEMFSE